MNFIEWKEDYSVNIAEFDAQHKKLISLINTLHNAMKDRKGPEALSEIFLELAQYTKNHFSAEEKRMKEKNYPFINAHLLEHNKLVKEVEKLFEEFQSGKLMMSMKVMSFLKEWLTQHIFESDKKYSEYL